MTDMVHQLRNQRMKRKRKIWTRPTMTR